jgi:hypothetical protein
MTTLNLELNGSPQITYNRSSRCPPYCQTVTNIEIYPSVTKEDNVHLFTVVPPVNASTIRQMEIMLPTTLIGTVEVFMVRPNYRKLVHQYTGEFLADMSNLMRENAGLSGSGVYEIYRNLPCSAEIFDTCINNNICHVPRLPSCSFVAAKLTQSGYWLEVKVNLKDNRRDPIKLRVSYGCSLSEDEVDRFQRTNLTDLTMRFEHIDCKLAKGINTIPLPNVNAGIFFLYTDAELKGEIHTDNALYPQFKIDSDRSQSLIGFNPTTYVVDVFHNMAWITGGLHNPCGNILLGPNANISFDMELPANVSIIFGYIDKIDYFQDIVIFSGYLTSEEQTIWDEHRAEVDNIINGLLQQGTVDITTIPLEDDETQQEGERSIGLTESPPGLLEDAPDELDTSLPTNDVGEEVSAITDMLRSGRGDMYVSHLMIKYERSIAIPMEPCDNCIISLEKIKEDEYFYTCETCNKPCLSGLFKKWIAHNHCCPHCRAHISQYPQLYYRPKENDHHDDSLQYGVNCGASANAIRTNTDGKCTVM